MMHLDRITLLVMFILFLNTASLWAGENLTVIYSGNLDGELEPCGCSAEGNLGGIKRRATVLSNLRKESPQLIVISAGGLLSSDGPGDRLKSEYILKGFASLGYDAIGVQWRDLVYGPEFALSQPLPWVVSNWKNDSVPGQRRIERSGSTLAFFSWLNPEESPLRQMQGKHALSDDSPVFLKSALTKAKGKGVLTVLASTMTADQAGKLIDLDQVDILIEKAAYENYGQPRMVGKTLVVQPGSRGMRLGRLDLEIDQGRITRWQHAVIPMPDKIKDAPELADWYAEYNARVKEEYLRRVEVKKRQKSGQSPYVGEEVCATCHTAQHAVWSETDHATAFESLENVSKAFDPDCIKCHTVGFDKPGGFVDFDATDHLMGVQCESCHGAGRAHVEAAGQQPLANATWSREQICGQCHVQKHSPGFNMESYWPKIAH
ncbi:multiheme c-type cytochrome [Kaarinaea lacus]